MIKKYIYLALISLITFSFTNATEKECRNFSFGTSLQTVKSAETAKFIKEEILLHNLTSLIFVDHKPEANYLYTYTFHCEKLTGLKIKRMSINGDNSFMIAATNYREAMDKYSLNSEVKIKEKVGDTGLKSFQLTSKKRKVYVMVLQENQDFFVEERIFK